ncbi:MAG: hypothetical protein QF384_12365, partial [Alphaproteobacteria bacterium]|nr:hypothetical protein [Alphaproteobacteria bacterium]
NGIFTLFRLVFISDWYSLRLAPCPLLRSAVRRKFHFMRALIPASHAGYATQQSRPKSFRENIVKTVNHNAFCKENNTKQCQGTYNISRLAVKYRGPTASSNNSAHPLRSLEGMQSDAKKLEPGTFHGCPGLIDPAALSRLLQDRGPAIPARQINWSGV